MEGKKYKILNVVIMAVLLFLCVLLLADKINLSTADLGRHIKNGEVILNAPWSQKMAVLNTNFYSYTENNFPFVNHHWLSGVIFLFIFYLFWIFRPLCFLYFFMHSSFLFII